MQLDYLVASRLKCRLLFVCFGQAEIVVELSHSVFVNKINFQRINSVVFF